MTRGEALRAWARARSTRRQGLTRGGGSPPSRCGTGGGRGAGMLSPAGRAWRAVDAQSGLYPVLPHAFPARIADPHELVCAASPPFTRAAYRAPLRRK